MSFIVEVNNVDEGESNNEHGHPVEELGEGEVFRVVVLASINVLKEFPICIPRRNSVKDDDHWEGANIVGDESTDVVEQIAQFATSVLFRHYKGKKEFHMHHYVLMMSLIPFLANQSEYETVMLGLLSGIFVEGITRWGFDPIWIPIDGLKQQEIEQSQYAIDQALMQAPTFVVLDNGVVKYMQ